MGGKLTGESFGVVVGRMHLRDQPVERGHEVCAGD